MAQIKDLMRMCYCANDCNECPFVDNGCYIAELPDNADEIVDKWIKQHTKKTYIQDFFEKFPNAPKDKSGEPVACIKSIYRNLDIKCGETVCIKCWNQEMKENA